MNGSSKYIAAVFLLFVLIFSSSYAQKKNKSQLEKEKKESIRKIKEAEKILSQTSSKKKHSIGELYAIQQQIKQMENLVGSIKGELTYINSDIWDTNEIINALGDDLEQLKSEYATMVYNTYKTTRGQTKLTFLFSSSTFNQFMMRLKYMEQYGSARRKQTEQINKVKEVLSGQITRLEKQKVEKNILLKEQLAESKKLKELKSKQNNVINSLASREKEITNQIEINKKSIARLNTLINEIIKAEIAKSTKTKNSTALKMTPEATKLAESFASNKGKLPWPVETGFVTKGYGKQQHPVWKHVVTENEGIDIQTNSSQEVRSVFDGEVTKVAHIPGLGKMVIIRHGDYFTVYSKLKDIFVQTGQKVNTKGSLGIVLTDNEGVSEVKFSVWKNTQKMNPKFWLYPR
ncbi:MAG: peptidoglycan DD-metalloendopeptidase family protein [Cyclobacteriaceae bacterium]|nr:peptidoglycan DD-metalloendopeptidase family protein [Cyclobacteriaceae bacterium]